MLIWLDFCWAIILFTFYSIVSNMSEALCYSGVVQSRRLNLQSVHALFYACTFVEFVS